MILIIFRVILFDEVYPHLALGREPVPLDHVLGDGAHDGGGGDRLRQLAPQIGGARLKG